MLTRSSKVILTIIAAIMVVIGVVVAPQLIDAHRAEEAALKYAEESPYGLKLIGEIEMTTDEYLLDWPERREEFPFSDHRITSYRFFEVQFPDSTVIVMSLYKSPDDGSWHRTW